MPRPSSSCSAASPAGSAAPPPESGSTRVRRGPAPGTPGADAAGGGACGGAPVPGVQATPARAEPPTRTAHKRGRENGKVGLAYSIRFFVLACAPMAKRKHVEVARVDECETLDELFTTACPRSAAPTCGGIYKILDRAIGAGCPLTLAIAGPGHRLRPAPDLADPAARNRLGRLPQHHRRRLLPRRPPQPRRLQGGPDPRGAHLQRRRRPARREAPSASPTWPSTRTCCFDQDRFVTACLARPEFQKQDDRHRAALPARPASTPRRRSKNGVEAGPARHLLPASPSRSSSARPATAASSSTR